jgi:trans-aconitate 2-methyltransferase
MATTADWDASRYHRVAQPHAAWGASVLDRLRLRGDETVLDAGCGSGKVTQQLLERLTQGGSVIAADLSPAMLEEARGTLKAFGEHVRFVQTDLLEIDAVLNDAQVDAVFSTATFHWINDHARLFAALHHVLAPAGRLVSQFGGGDNLAEFVRATDAVAARPEYVPELGGKQLWRYYTSPEETQQRLQAAGFTQVEAWLEASPQSFPSEEAFTEFTRAVVLRNHLNALPEAKRQPFQRAVAQEVERRTGGFILDYVRLNADASA